MIYTAPISSKNQGAIGL